MIVDHQIQIKLNPVNLERYILIVGVVELADYLQTPECFEDLILLCAKYSTLPMPVPSVDVALEETNAIAGTRDSLDHGGLASQGQSPLDQA